MSRYKSLFLGNTLESTSPMIFQGSIESGVKTCSENRMAGKADCFYDGSIFPFGDAKFDSIVMNESHP